MFTIEQINEAIKKVKSGADFPQFIQDLKIIGVTRHTTGHFTTKDTKGFHKGHKELINKHLCPLCFT